MRTNQASQVVITEDDFVEILYRGQDVNHLVVETPAWVEQYKQMCSLFELPDNLHWEEESSQTREEYIEQCINDWNLPAEYQSFDVQGYVLNKCTTPAQQERVQLELVEFEKRNMTLVLRFLKYFVDTMKSHNLVWGAGRGSSVASYVLYLLGIHRVDSMAYDLDIKEFLK